MYSRQDFIERFRRTDTDELLEQLATVDLTAEARDAMHVVLRERGVKDSDLGSLLKEAKKQTFRRPGATNQCDYCGKSVRLSRVKDAGQKFCSQACLSTARLHEAAVDVTDQDALRLAVEIRKGLCPSCRKTESPVEVRKHHWIWSVIVFTRWGTSSKTCCRRCGVKSNLEAILTSAGLGWWGIPWGLLVTPAQIVANIVEIFRSRRGSVAPSEALIEVARLQLAAQLLEDAAHSNLAGNRGPNKPLEPTA